MTEKKQNLNISSREQGSIKKKVMLTEVCYSENFAYFSLLHVDLENSNLHKISFYNMISLNGMS